MNKIPRPTFRSSGSIARAKALSVELGTPITPGLRSLGVQASRGIEDIYELTYIRKDEPVLRGGVGHGAARRPRPIIGYLLIGTDQPDRKQVGRSG